MQLVNVFDVQGNWYKANLHCHTTSSDGEVSAQQRAEQYRKRHYDILAITDHRITSSVENLCSDDFLVITGLEAHPYCGPDFLYHLICLNVPEGFELPDEYDANVCVRNVRQAGGEVILGHPYWCGHNINEMLAVQGYIGIEVFNATCTKIGKGFSGVHWDELLDAGRFVGGIACDDTHRGRDIFMGWTMIKTERLTTTAVMDALRSGAFYASCGPVIDDFRVQDNIASVRCTPAAEVHFICDRDRGFSYYTDGGEPITEAEFNLHETSKYVRVEVVDEKGNHAWTNPILLDCSRR
ncbi:MAG: CehA/McbA family metallohydrolase [Planctomycetota bacterium]